VRHAAGKQPQRFALPCLLKLRLQTLPLGGRHAFGRRVHHRANLPDDRGVLGTHNQARLWPIPTDDSTSVRNRSSRSTNARWSGLDGIPPPRRCAFSAISECSVSKYGEPNDDYTVVAHLLVPIVRMWDEIHAARDSYPISRQSYRDTGYPRWETPGQSGAATTAILGRRGRLLRLTRAGLGGLLTGGGGRRTGNWTLAREVGNGRIMLLFHMQLRWRCGARADTRTPHPYG